MSSYLGSPKSRLCDLADVIELIKANSMPRDFSLDARVSDTYQEPWDELADELKR